MSKEVAQRLEETPNKGKETIAQQLSPDPIYDLTSSAKTEVERLIFKSFEIGKTKRWEENQALHYAAPAGYCGGFSIFSSFPSHR